MQANRTHKLLRLALATFVCLLIFFPFLWMVSTSFKSNPELISADVSLWPKMPTLEHYVSAIVERDFLRYFLNGLIVSLGTTVTAVVVASLAGYALARVKPPGSKIFLLLIVSSQMFPSLLLLMPLYDLLHSLKLLNTHPGLMLVYTTFALPFSVWMLRNYLITIPKDLDEAALIDGCNRLQAFFKVVLPSARPGIVAVAVFCMILSWDDFIYANTFISTDVLRTPSVALHAMIGEFGTDWGMLMAGTVLTTAPILALFAMFQGNLTNMLGGGVKG